VLGVAEDASGQLWFASKAGVGCRTPKGWRLFEGKDGLPWNEFTGIATGPAGEVWFTTSRGVIRWDGAGPRSATSGTWMTTSSSISPTARPS
ncbi:MAG: hypothetical protein RL218_1062, partial [Actinomycetota bacterium]